MQGTPLGLADPRVPRYTSDHFLLLSSALAAPRSGHPHRRAGPHSPALPRELTVGSGPPRMHAQLLPGAEIVPLPYRPPPSNSSIPRASLRPPAMPRALGRCEGLEVCPEVLGLSLLESVSQMCFVACSATRCHKDTPKQQCGSLLSSRQDAATGPAQAPVSPAPGDGRLGKPWDSSSLSQHGWPRG